MLDRSFVHFLEFTLIGSYHNYSTSWESLGSIRTSSSNNEKPSNSALSEKILLDY